MIEKIKKHKFAEEHIAIIKHLRKWHGLRFAIRHKDNDIIIDGIRGREVMFVNDEAIFSETKLEDTQDAKTTYKSRYILKTVSLTDPDIIDKIVNFFKTY